MKSHFTPSPILLAFLEMIRFSPASHRLAIGHASFLLLSALFLAQSTLADTLQIDFDRLKAGSVPEGYTSTHQGEGQPGSWTIVEDKGGSGLQAITEQGTGSKGRSVLAQTSRQAIDEHFPMFIYDAEVFSDFKLSCRVKMVAGEMEQMAGIAFRIQDAKNYYVVRASAKGDSFRFYKVVDGVRGRIIGPSNVPIPLNEWIQIEIACTGNTIEASMNGQPMFPPLNDNSFRRGKIGFWTKSDSVSYFTDLKMNYASTIPLAQKMVDSVMEKYPRLLGVELWASQPGQSQIQLMACTDKSLVGQAGTEVESDVLDNGKWYTGKEKKEFTVVMPLRDRNGNPIAAVRVRLKPYIGQTTQAALSRARPILAYMQSQVTEAEDLFY